MGEGSDQSFVIWKEMMTWRPAQGTSTKEFNLPIMAISGHIVIQQALSDLF